MRASRANRTDSNQTQIVSDLRKMGVSVWITSSIGNGGPDIVCGWRKRNFLFEIKDPNKSPSAQKLTTDELEFGLYWAGSIAIIRSADEAMAYMRRNQ